MFRLLFLVLVHKAAGCSFHSIGFCLFIGKVNRQPVSPQSGSNVFRETGANKLAFSFQQQPIAVPDLLPTTCIINQTKSRIVLYAALTQLFPIFLELNGQFILKQCNSRLTVPR